MCSYCGCRNIPMIAKLNAEHDAIVNSTYALQVALREQNVESAKTAGKILAELLHPHTHREQVGLFAEMKKDELFTEHIASLCAEHDELDGELSLIAAGDLTRITAMITLLNNHIDRRPGLPGRQPVGHHPKTRAHGQRRRRSRPARTPPPQREQCWRLTPNDGQVPLPRT